MSDYALLSDGRIVDITPINEGKLPLVLDNGKWITFEEGKTNLYSSRRIDEAEAQDLISDSNHSKQIFT